MADILIRDVHRIGSAQEKGLENVPLPASQVLLVAHVLSLSEKVASNITVLTTIRPISLAGSFLSYGGNWHYITIFI